MLRERGLLRALAGLPRLPWGPGCPGWSRHAPWWGRQGLAGGWEGLAGACGGVEGAPRPQAKHIGGKGGDGGLCGHRLGLAQAKKASWLRVWLLLGMWVLEVGVLRQEGLLGGKVLGCVDVEGVGTAWGIGAPWGVCPVGCVCAKRLAAQGVVEVFAQLRVHTCICVCMLVSRRQAREMP